MATTITPAPYRMVRIEDDKEGKCLRCGGNASRFTRWYKNLETGKESFVSVRNSCGCPEWADDGDPYKPYARPAHFVNGVWHEWEWNASTQKWEGTPEA